MANLKLQVLWLNNSIGLAINKKTSKGLIPLTPYYFWPLNDAWEQIQFELETKEWIDTNERLSLLNEIVEITNCWKSFRNQTKVYNKLTLPSEKYDFKDVCIIGLD
jgi:30S ribosomal protein 3